MFTQYLTATFATTLLFMLNRGSSSFAPFGVVTHIHNKALPPLFHPESEADNMYIIYKARERADAANCSPHEAQMYLNEIVRLQSGCAAGKYTGQDWCDLQDESIFGAQIAAIVAKLTEKVEAQSSATSHTDDTPRGTAYPPDLGLILCYTGLMLLSTILNLQQGVNLPAIFSVLGEATPLPLY